MLMIEILILYCIIMINNHRRTALIIVCIKKVLNILIFIILLQIMSISNYEAIWIVDDDIKIETKDINKMFSIF